MHWRCAGIRCRVKKEESISIAVIKAGAGKDDRYLNLIVPVVYKGLYPTDRIRIMCFIDGEKYMIVKVRTDYYAVTHKDTSIIYVKDIG